MKPAIRPSLNLALLVVPACFLVTSLLTGCSDSSANGPAAAKNMYVIQAGSTNNVETDSVLIFPATSTGASTPAFTVPMPSGLTAICVATSPTGQLYVGGFLSDNSGEILVYAPNTTAQGTPTATYLSAPGSFDIPVYMAINSKGDLFVEGNNETLEVFPAAASPSAPPSQYITTLQVGESFSYGIGADAAGNIYVSDLANDALNVFAAGATGDAVPTRVITGMGSSIFGALLDITADGDGNIMIANLDSNDEARSASAHAKPRFPNDARARFLPEALRAHTATAPATVATGIYIFGTTASGAATPTITLSGAITTINSPGGLAFDLLDNIYYTDYETGGNITIMSFKAGATGNVAPMTSTTSTAYQGERFLNEIAVY